MLKFLIVTWFLGAFFTGGYQLFAGVSISLEQMLFWFLYAPKWFTGVCKRAGF